MKKYSLEEWYMIKSYLYLFFCASSLKFIPQKSTFHFSGIQGENLEKYKEVFSYNFVEFIEGFRYLGYYIKVDKNAFEYSRWLIIKFENRVKHWCNHWLTLDGWCTLAKEVLETQSVYWMALVEVPYYVLSRIRKLILDFLSSGVEKLMEYISAVGKILQRRNNLEVGDSRICSYLTLPWQWNLYGKYWWNKVSRIRWSNIKIYLTIQWLLGSEQIRLINHGPHRFGKSCWNRCLSLLTGLVGNLVMVPPY